MQYAVMRVHTIQEKVHIMDKIMSFYMENGLQVVLNKIPAIKTIITSMWIKQGSQNETSQNNGISHIAEHMVVNKNNRLNPELTEHFERLSNAGVNYNATTTKENTYYYFQGMRESIDMCLDALRITVATNRKFPSDLLDKELRIIESEASSFYSSFNQINARIAQALYGNFGVGKVILGTLKNIKETTLYAVENLVCDTYTPENSVLIIMGDVDYEEDAEKAIKTFQAWEDRETIKVEESIDNEPGVYFDGAFSGENAIVSIGFRIPYSNENVRICAELLSLILSDPVMNGYIPIEVRQRRGLAYNVGGYVNQYKKMCTLGIACASSVNNIAEVISVSLNEIRKVRENTVDNNALDRAKMTQITRRNIEFADPLKRTIHLGKYCSYGRVYSFEDEIRKIRKIDISYFNSVVQQITRTENLGLALVGKADIDKIVDSLYI